MGFDSFENSTSNFKEWVDGEILPEIEWCGDSWLCDRCATWINPETWARHYRVNVCWDCKAELDPTYVHPGPALALEGAQARWYSTHRRRKKQEEISNEKITVDLSVDIGLS